MSLREQEAIPAFELHRDGKLLRIFSCGFVEEQDSPLPHASMAVINRIPILTALAFQEGLKASPDTDQDSQ